MCVHCVLQNHRGLDLGTSDVLQRQRFYGSVRFFSRKSRRHEFIKFFIFYRGYGYPVLNSNHGKWFSIVHTALGSMCVNVILMFGFTFCLSPSSASSRMKIPSSPSLLSWIRFHSYRNRRRIAICVLCLLYVGVGAVFAMRPGNVVTERDENPLGSGFTNGVLFAVSSLSSVAQYAPVQKNSQMLLTCLYILFGTPLWACA